MGRPKVSDGKPLSIRLDTQTRERLEALRDVIAPGLTATLAQVARGALVLGIETMEKRARVTAKKGTADK